MVIKVWFSEHSPHEAMMPRMHFTGARWLVHLWNVSQIHGISAPNQYILGGVNQNTTPNYFLQQFE